MNKMVLAPTTLPGCPPLEYVDAAAAAGFDGIGMRLYPQSPTAPFTPVVGNPSLMADVQRAVAASGLEVYDAFSCYLRPEPDFEGLKPVLAYTADLGGKFAVVICDDMDWGRAADNLGRIADLAAQSGLTAVLEGPIYGRLINTLPKVLQLVKDAGRDNITVCIDTYQLYRSPEGVGALRPDDMAMFGYVQLTDGDPEPVQFLVPGKGSVPLHQILEVFPPDVTLGLECPPPKDVQVDSTDWLRKVLSGARNVVNGVAQA
jgi:sugar phosphate isomerase/epimerase